jgi:flap endonuclease-1
MGIRMLNKYLTEYSSNAMKKLTLSELSGKKIAIDVSIFLYQFKGENALIENMTEMIKQFRNNNIVPIYIFDGTPPDEKTDVLNDRDTVKKASKEKCDNIENILNTNNNLSDKERSLLIDKLNNEKKNCLRITNANIRDVKKLMKFMGVPYLEAKGEADELCVHLVKKNMAWACITQDMDMFVYGCPRVLRNYSLKKGTVLLYTMTNILDNLRMTQAEFTEVCSFCTDYYKTRFTIFAAMGLFYKYLRRKKGIIAFYDWLIYTKIISNNDKQNLLNVKKMFMIDINEPIKQSTLVTTNIMNNELKTFMEKRIANN